MFWSYFLQLIRRENPEYNQPRHEFDSAQNRKCIQIGSPLQKQTDTALSDKVERYFCSDIKYSIDSL